MLGCDALGAAAFQRPGAHGAQDVEMVGHAASLRESRHGAHGQTARERVPAGAPRPAAVTWARVRSARRAGRGRPPQEARQSGPRRSARHTCGSRSTRLIGALTRGSAGYPTPTAVEPSARETPIEGFSSCCRGHRLAVDSKHQRLPRHRECHRQSWRPAPSPAYPCSWRPVKSSARSRDRRREDDRAGWWTRRRSQAVVRRHPRAIVWNLLSWWWGAHSSSHALIGGSWGHDRRGRDQRLKIDGIVTKSSSRWSLAGRGLYVAWSSWSASWVFRNAHPQAEGRVRGSSVLGGYMAFALGSNDPRNDGHLHLDLFSAGVIRQWTCRTG